MRITKEPVYTGYKIGRIGPQDDLFFAYYAAISFDVWTDCSQGRVILYDGEEKRRSPFLVYDRESDWTEDNQQANPLYFNGFHVFRKINAARRYMGIANAGAKNYGQQSPWKIYRCEFKGILVEGFESVIENHYDISNLFPTIVASHIRIKKQPIK